MVIKTLHSFPFLGGVKRIRRGKGKDKKKEKGKERKGKERKGRERKEKEKQEMGYLVIIGEERHLGALTTAL